MLLWKRIDDEITIDASSSKVFTIQSQDEDEIPIKEFHEKGLVYRDSKF
ncbi:13075_t:CDS:2 [Funneliformis caledonium]|uniref:13075_t:CDS:1 n=1 Tax=Funneliformis caledonium TaxID=1117310 RepID=A0A9N9FP86_9GLOM|nr:13075_t:CDS:2 [Funneliformis caledonium]